MSVMLVRLSDCEFFYIYIFDLVFGYNPFIWKILLGKLCFSLFPLFSPATVCGWWCKGVVGGLGLICTHAFATCCVSVCAFQTRVLGTLCVPSSGETRALLSLADVNFYLLVFPHEKNGA